MKELRRLSIFIGISTTVFFAIQAYTLSFTVPEAKKGTFRAEQMAIDRVKSAYQLKWDTITTHLKSINVEVNQLEVFIRGFKDEAELEVWIKQKKDTIWKLYTTYPICAPSGELGPKRCQGDYQVPEGFYKVNVFNPYSNYHLSLGVSYPNSSDKIFGCKRDPGGAIMIHGNCCTIGCIPITDDKIRELYVLCVEAKNAGQTSIPIHLFPIRFTDVGILAIKANQMDLAVRILWDNLRTGYDWFEMKKNLPKVTVDAKGKYVFQ